MILLWLYLIIGAVFGFVAFILCCMALMNDPVPNMLVFSGIVGVIVAVLWLPLVIFWGVVYVRDR